MRQYLDLLQEIKDQWVDKEDRTGVGTRSIFGAQMKFDLAEWFPLVTTKKTFLRGIIIELIWLIRWETNIKYLVDRDVGIRNEWPFQNWLDHATTDLMPDDIDTSTLREKKLHAHHWGPSKTPITLTLSEKYPKYSNAWKAKKDEFIAKIKALPTTHSFVQKRWNLGPVYGQQWRNFNEQGVDQLAIAIEQIQKSPTSRRIIVNAWNPVQLDEMLLPPCHMFYQFNVDTTNKRLHLQMYQRSCDMFLGVPFNIASYSALLLIVAQITGYAPWIFVHTLGDTHIYQNHRDAVNEQLTREPYPLPTLHIKKEIRTLEDVQKLEREDFELLNYQAHPRLSAPVAV